MKKLLAVVVILGAGGFLVYRYVLTSPEKRSCQRLVELCGGNPAEVERCVGGALELGKTSQEAIAKFDTCVADAKTCAEGVGCVGGAGLSATGQVLNNFLKGVGKAMGK